MVGNTAILSAISKSPRQALCSLPSSSQQFTRHTGNSRRGRKCTRWENRGGGGRGARSASHGRQSGTDAARQTSTTVCVCLIGSHALLPPRAHYYHSNGSTVPAPSTGACKGMLPSCIRSTAAHSLHFISTRMPNLQVSDARFAHS